MWNQIKFSNTSFESLVWAANYAICYAQRYFSGFRHSYESDIILYWQVRRKCASQYWKLYSITMQILGITPSSAKGSLLARNILGKIGVLKPPSTFNIVVRVNWDLIIHIKARFSEMILKFDLSKIISISVGNQCLEFELRAANNPY